MVSHDSSFGAKLLSLPLKSQSQFMGQANWKYFETTDKASDLNHRTLIFKSARLWLSLSTIEVGTLAQVSMTKSFRLGELHRAAKLAPVKSHRLRNTVDNAGREAKASALVCDRATPSRLSTNILRRFLSSWSPLQGSLLARRFVSPK